MANEDVMALEQSVLETKRSAVLPDMYYRKHHKYDDLDVLEKEILVEDVVYKTTRDPKLLLQYFNIRQQAYAGHIGHDDFSGAYDGADAHSKIVVAMEPDGKVIGGARVTPNDPLLEYHLPMEEDGFELKDFFPEYDLEHNRYGEYSRLAFLPEYRNGNHSFCMHKLLTNVSRNMGLKYIFAGTSTVHARECRGFYRKLGLTMKTHMRVKLPYKPSYQEHWRFYVSVLEL